MIETAIVAGLSQAIIGQVGAKLKDPNTLNELGSKSLVEYTAPARAEPICIIDTRLVGHDFLTDIMEMLNGRFAGYYITAGSLMGSVGKIKAVQALDKINPNRSVSFNVANSVLGVAASMNSMAVVDVTPVGEVDTDSIYAKLPAYAPDALMDGSGISASTEARDDRNGNNNNQRRLTAAEQRAEDARKEKERKEKEREDGKRNDTNVRSFKAGVDLTTVANLSIGQTVILTISDDGVTRDIPVMIRLIAYPTDPQTITTILKWSEKDNSLRARLGAWRAGELNGWRDLIFMRDVFTERARTLMKDKTGLFKTMLTRIEKNKLSAMFSLTPSVGTISDICVISQDTLEDLELQLYGKMSDFKLRQRVMDATGIMIICVVDPETEYVTVYTYTQPLPDEYSVKQVKSASKNSGGDITEIIKLLNPQAGSRF